MTRNHTVRLVREWSLVLLAPLAIGCDFAKATLDPSASASEAVGMVTLAPSNLLLAVGQTAQLTLDVKSLTGQPMTEFDSVAYVVRPIGDTLRVKVNNTGVVTALAPTAVPAGVNVLAFKNNTVRADQVLVNVTQN